MRWLLGLAVALGSVAITCAASAARPNVLVILSDDQRADAIAERGNPFIVTPTLDRLARSGTAFTQAYCMGALRGAVCVPARAMLMTGRGLFRVNEEIGKQPNATATQDEGAFQHGGCPVTPVPPGGIVVFIFIALEGVEKGCTKRGRCGACQLSWELEELQHTPTRLLG